MNDNRRDLRRLLAAGALACLACTHLCRAAQADKLPRYKLQVGQVLAYRYVNPLRNVTTKEGRFFTDYICEWTAYVTRQHTDGSWRILFRDQRTTRVERPRKEPTEHTFSWDGFFDLSADGRLVEDGIHPPADPTALFPPLPPDEASLRGTWEAQLALTGAKRRMRPADRDPIDAASFRFIEQHEQIGYAAHSASESREYVFDRESGLVHSMTITFDSSRKGGKHKISRMELTSSRQLPAKELNSLQVESDRYIASIVRYQQAMDRARGNLKTTVADLDQAGAELDRIDSQLTLDVLREVLGGKRKQFALERASCMENAERFGKLIDRPSPDWTTTDSDDNTRSLADFRGKVVVLDFWYRGCGPCIQLMPQLNELAADFAGQNVAIVGMNSDTKVEDARFVIESMKLKYETLKDGTLTDGIHDKYQVTGWPTSVVIDRQGIVRHVHCGYAPNLRTELADKIRNFLSDKEPDSK